MPLRVAICLHLQAPASLCGCANNAVEFVDKNFPLLVRHLIAFRKTTAVPFIGRRGSAGQCDLSHTLHVVRVLPAGLCSVA
jgi:hypothetical protein